MGKESAALRIARVAADETVIFGGTTNPTPRLNFRTAEGGTLLGFLEITDIGTPTHSGTLDDPVLVPLTFDLDPAPTWIASGDVGYWEVVDRNNARHKFGTRVAIAANANANTEIILNQSSLAVVAGAQILIGEMELTYPTGSF